MPVVWTVLCCRFLRLALRDGHQFQGDAALALFIHIEQMLADFVHAGTDIVGEGRPVRGGARRLDRAVQAGVPH